MLKSYIQNVELIRTIIFSPVASTAKRVARGRGRCARRREKDSGSTRLCTGARGRPHGWLQPAGRSGQRPAALLAAGRRGQRPATRPGAAMRTGRQRRCAGAGGRAARLGAAAHRAGGRWRGQEQRCDLRGPAAQAMAAAAHVQVGGGGSIGW